ncbi:MAG: hypothetical protein Q7S58_15230 [Candidatus Binatus sp.]|uniref:hypothetical protein n=1 Tax=Candidatus Binatus sp. TaxID=2811406 RepID=UPI002717F690|nr:hypothetical protein [Candidatus Binatus sp.]MDO8433755.1 hypothetical protein [Candidatus Binatus sp.]
MSHRIRLACQRSQQVELTTSLLQTIVESYRLPSISKQQDNFIQWFGETLLHQAVPHASIAIEPRIVTALIGAAPPVSSGGLRYVMQALANKGYVSRVSQDGERIQMRPTGWERYEELTTPKSSAVPYSPRELPLAIDFLNAVWEKKFTEPLVRIRSAEKVASLGFPCANFEDFKARVGDLGEMLRWIEVPDEKVPEDRGVKREEKLIRLTVAMESVAPESEQENARRAIAILKDIVKVRNKMTHVGSPELIAALARLGIDFPISDYGLTWDAIRARAADALHAIRTAVQALD